jgi:uncharacterized protein
VKIMLFGLFADRPPYRKFLILVSVVLLSTITFSLLGGLMVNALFGVDVISDTSLLGNLDDPLVVSAIKMLQLITTGLGMFVIPSVISAILFSRHPSAYLGLNKPLNFLAVAGVVMIMFTMVPLINFLMAVNEQLQLPSFLSSLESWMRTSEEQAARLTEVFLKMDHTSDLLYHLLIVAVVPAIGEELLFRGVVQRLFQDLTGRIHLSIFITAALFSAVHMQFYGFLPRMALGLLFGYLLLWTGSMWMPILAHFINNGMAVLLAFLSGKNMLPFDQDTIGTGATEWPLLLISIVLTSAVILMIYRRRVKISERDVAEW